MVDIEDVETKLIAVIGDEDTVTGFLLAGTGQRDAKGCNYLVVDNKTKRSQIEQAFNTMTTRHDIGIVLINQNVANEIRHLLNTYDKITPTILEIPSKEHPYDARKDYIMKRVMLKLGMGSTL